MDAPNRAYSLPTRLLGANSGLVKISMLSRRLDSVGMINVPFVSIQYCRPPLLAAHAVT